MFFKNKPLALKLLTVLILVVALFTVTACKKDGAQKEVEVTSIVVTGAKDAVVIDELEGGLQMSATVTPKDATNQKVVWSIIDGTGTASITKTGLVKAETNGTLTVVATSVSQNSIKGTKQITITNQVAIDMDATLTNLTVEGITVMGFKPLTNNYVMVLSNGETVTPKVVATKHTSTATVVIVNAVNIKSNDVLDRTTKVTVTSQDELTVRVYTIVFESPILMVDLGSANDYVILASTGISTATSSDITGDIGVNPSPATYITGFSLIMDAGGVFSSSSQVTGKVYASDYSAPTPVKLVTAVQDMQLAYADAAGRTANYIELFAGDLSAKTVTTGVYKWGNSVLIDTDLVITGDANDIFIFQIAGSLTMAANVKITLSGGALAKNIYWQVADTVSIGTGASFNGIVLAMTNISVGTNASINGQLYAQTAVTLDANIVVKPK